MRAAVAAAGVVTFNPDIQRLWENLTSVTSQCDRAIVVDNGSDNIEEIVVLLRNFPNVTLTANAENLGIANALNQIMNWAASFAQWVVLLDQDTVPSKDLVNLLRSHAKSDVAIVAPTVVDRSQKAASVQNAEVSEVNYCITSGALYSVAAWQSVEGYDEAMFIDFVDFDYCIRVREHGYKIKREGAAVILHEIGRITRHGPFTAYHYSPFRSYHMARDMLYYARKHCRSEANLRVQQRGIVGTYGVLVRKLIIVALFEEDRLQRLSALVRGIVSGTFRQRTVRKYHL
ncbi:glycosyltransferase family 2 protein [Arthrobacter sp. ISL-85]|uniref:glycosyltransferase family 2 protein n=1 Tax=Arthrobacter sp. ISL-85 TaxID=2819115 RepID=UPI001BECCF25|nr:glycosyltransferase family 2 protein [Arthrobacter sp. ISL-85]MBT2568959.1 glycosyltransferase family 2 protein [Arthrobacter sp. ISL-85]